MNVVNSYGRSGSTVLAESLGDVLWITDLRQMPEGIYKTHDYPSDVDAKIVYTFANPLDVIASVIKMSRKKHWLNLHCQHMRVPYFDISDIYREDKLHLEDHLNAWLGVEGVCFARYEAMWDYQQELSDYLGVQVSLPAYRPRESTSRRVGCYRSLKKQVDQLGDFFIT